MWSSTVLTTLTFGSDTARPNREPPMPQDHYFSAEPASPAELREQRVVLAGREVTVQTAGGIFSPDGIDKGTAVLLKHVPDPPQNGTFLDLGCGWGPMARSCSTPMSMCRRSARSPRCMTRSGRRPS